MTSFGRADHNSKNTKVTEFALRGLVYRKPLEIENPVPQITISAIQDHHAECFPDNGPRTGKYRNNHPLYGYPSDTKELLVQRKSRGAEPGISSKYRVITIVMQKQNGCLNTCNSSFNRHRQRAKLTAVYGRGSSGNSN